MAEKKKVLIIEDEIAFSKMVKIRLEAAGYEVSIASDAYLGTQEIVKTNPDLIILDLMMPAGGGFEILDRIKNIPSKATIPVVILTGKTIESDVKARAKAYDVAAVFTKPYESDEFVDKINSLIPR